MQKNKKRKLEPLLVPETVSTNPYINPLLPTKTQLPSSMSYSIFTAKQWYEVKCLKARYKLHLIRRGELLQELLVQSEVAMDGFIQQFILDVLSSVKMGLISFRGEKEHEIYIQNLIVIKDHGKSNEVVLNTVVMLKKHRMLLNGMKIDYRQTFEARQRLIKLINASLRNEPLLKLFNASLRNETLLTKEEQEEEKEQEEEEGEEEEEIEKEDE